MERTNPVVLSERARLLLDLSREISSLLDLQEVLDKSLLALRKLIDFDGGSIQLVEDGFLRLVAADPEPTQDALAFRLPVGQGFGGSVAETGEPIYSPDVSMDERAHPEGRKRASTAGVRSYFAAPLIETGHVIGIAQFDSRRADAFPPHVQELVLSFVPTIAAAVQTARAFSREVETVNQLLEAERLKNDFLAVVSHELRTPLTSVIGLADTLENHIDSLDKETMLDIARRISLAGRNLAHSIEDLLRLSSAERGNVETAISPENVGDVLRSWHDDLDTDTHPLKFEIDPDLPKASFDTGHLRQILDNLVSNARKFSPDGFGIEVHAHKVGDRVKIQVRDYGDGIPADMQERIFERFFQVEAPATRSVRGLGIGLTLVKHYARLMGAEVSVESAPGKGSTFAVTLRPA